MDKRMFGKLLGEVHRLQYKVAPDDCPVSPATIYGLVNGIESVVDAEIQNMWSITADEIRAMGEVLQPYHDDAEKLKHFSGFYEIEDKLRSRGISRDKAIVILTYFKADNRYVQVIEKMDSGGSPSECRRFDNLWL